ncbi:DNA repair endonuclease UVH1 isoform X2 [Mangifera indica]|uniref:DNA repair endonuclease UVH1 isoform X2 n=1 Tax=Mangifera indica TaxID=29780 RepID=UPI001CF9545F|nr:DNA repair endonuclease UVH1 isoform X2 [Mangifera indica]
MVLGFHEHIITDLLEESSGGLVVLSSGLSLPKLISSLLLLHSPSQGTLLLLSSSSSLKSQILHFLSPHSPNHIPSEITADLSVSHRHSLYSSGQIFFITARIFIVDLLTQKLPTSHIAGIIILNAHTLSDSSTETFICRIVKSFNKKAYIRAFSDKPTAMVSGFSKTERIMKSLFIRKLHLWPRFQVNVSEELERDPPVVVDIRVPMTKYMVGIQKAVLEVMDACLKEMRKTNKVDVEDLTVENGLFKSFDEIVRRQLDPIWHTLGKKTRQLVSDLKTLRKLLEYLVRYDAVSFLKYLDTLRVSESFRSVWIFAESSYKIFDYAKKRVYRLMRSDSVKLEGQSTSMTRKKRKLKGAENNENEDAGTLSSSTNTVVLEEVLEEAPKWKVLREVLQEIEEERQKQATSKEEVLHEDKESDHSIVLVVCKDERSCMQLEDFIMNDSQKVMREEWEKYLLSKVELRAVQISNKKKKLKEPKGYGILDGAVPVTPAQNAEASSVSNQEHDALLAAASEIRNRAISDDVSGDDPSTLVGNSGHREGRGKGKGRKGQANVWQSRNGVNKSNKKASTEDKSEISGSENEGQADKIQLGATNSNSEDTVKSAFVDKESTEVQKFEASIRRENSAFESLIRQKSLMMIPVDQDGHCLAVSSSVETQATSSQNAITRKAGGRKEAEKEMQVIVDMREFMSSLPNVLHQKGMRIIPVTLEVGDYILSPLICVERKSIQDLFTSFTSGRLYHQVETMVRYYRIPVLLIEFSQDKSFSFQSASDIGDDVTPHNIISKLSLLVLHFPRLRVIWSRSLHATAEIFASLKANQDEPEEAKAIRVGVPSEEGVVENDVRAENYNTSAVEFLRRLPGVTDANYRSIMDGCKSLAELALLPVEKLGELMGGQKAAQTLRDFLDAKYPTLL